MPRMRCAASSASGCRGVVACASACSAWSRARSASPAARCHSASRTSPSTRPSVASMKSSHRRCRSSHPRAESRSPASSASLAAKLELDRHLTHQLAGLARGTNLRRLVRTATLSRHPPAPGRASQGTRGARPRGTEGRYILLRENLARLAPSPFQHQQRDPGVPRQIRVHVAAVLDHPPGRALRRRGNQLPLCQVVRLIGQHSENQLLALAHQREQVQVACKIRGDRRGVRPSRQARLALQRVGHRKSAVGIADGAEFAGRGGWIGHLCEVVFTLRARLGKVSAAREDGDQRAAVGDLVDPLFAAASGARPRRQPVNHIRRGGDGRDGGAMVATVAKQQPQERLRAGAEAGIPAAAASRPPPPPIRRRDPDRRGGAVRRRAAAPTRARQDPPLAYRAASSRPRSARPPSPARRHPPPARPPAPATRLGSSPACWR